MEAHLQNVAKACLSGAEQNSMSFPEIVGTLMQNGFEGYTVDYRRGDATYYLLSGEKTTLPIHVGDVPMGPAFDSAGVRAAIREAQAQDPGYTYKGFCEKVMASGCVGYIVSFSGRRVLYFGRTAETLVEPFPQVR